MRCRRREVRARVVELLRQVGIPAPETRLGAFPHQLSGGMNQRVMIAMAIACNPRLLIADEPTTALDVTIQQQILDLLPSLQRERGMALVLITHDMGVIAETAHRVQVMYAGQMVEEADTARLFAAPRHPYTAALLDALPERALPSVRWAAVACRRSRAWCRGSTTGRPAACSIRAAVSRTRGAARRPRRSTVRPARGLGVTIRWATIRRAKSRWAIRWTTIRWRGRARVDGRPRAAPALSGGRRHVCAQGRRARGGRRVVHAA